MTYIRLDTYTICDPTKQHPNTSLPRFWEGGEIEGILYAKVIPTPEPEFNPIFYSLSEGEPELIGEKWFQRWELIERPINEIINDLHKKRKEVRTLLEFSGFIFNGHLIDSDRDSILRISNAVTAAIGSIITQTPFQTVWRCADDYDISLNAFEILQMQTALSIHWQKCHDWSANLKEVIDDPNSTISILQNLKFSKD